jgi:outer membrane protein OmpA-like peptidoglycan-associated protein
MMRRAVMAFTAMTLMTGSALAQSTVSTSLSTSTVSQTQQTSPQQTQTGTMSQTMTMEPDRRPATTTVDGDTGLWFLPTAEVLGPRKWSFSLYRKNLDYEQGFTDVSTWPITFAVGIGDRVEFFTAVEAVRRIDRDSRPIFFDTGTDEGGGVVNEYPFVTRAWSGNDFGDIWVGAKFAFLSQYEQDPVSFGLRARVKIPTANDEEGAGTGKLDFGVDAILSGEANERVEWTGTVGYMHRGDPDDFDISNGIRWGFGLGFPSRQGLRLTAEIHGEQYLSDEVVATRRLLATDPADGSLSPLISGNDSPINATLGLTWQHRKGFFAGAGVNWAIKLDGRSESGSFEDETGDSLGFQLRLGYHPGVRIYTPPPPPPPPPPPVVVNRPPTVTARCEPGTVAPGGSATVIATAQDPDGDALTYSWRAASGTLATPSDRQSVWTAPAAAGSYPVTVTVTDAKGATASDTATCQVVAPVVEVKKYEFEDVYFDFDRYSLRQDALRVLDEAVAAMKADSNLRLQIEGHTCNIGTAEYNLALGERRAMSVRDYLVSQGISADRLSTVSYGEERPKHDNAREETRRLNRRAALTVRLTLE